MIDIVLPCLNEAEALPWVLARIPPNARALVVDNGSTDGSLGVAAAFGATVVRCAQRGYGAACHAGLTASRAEFVAFCDCDATIDPGEITRLARAVLEGSADLAVGRRVPARDAGWPLHARLGNQLLARRVSRHTGVTLRDIGPVRIAAREALLELAIEDRRCGYPVETVLRAAQAGWRIRQEDVTYLPRAGESKVSGTVAGTWHTLRDVRAVLTS